MRGSGKGREGKESLGKERKKEDLIERRMLGVGGDEWMDGGECFRRGWRGGRCVCKMNEMGSELLFLYLSFVASCRVVLVAE